MPHDNLFLKYNLITDDALENASRFEIHLVEVKADDVVLRLDGKILALKGLSSKEDYSKNSREEDLIFNDSKIINLVEKKIPTQKKISFKEFARQQRLKNS